jgi:RNA polymerase-binding transcription factor
MATTKKSTKTSPTGRTTATGAAKKKSSSTRARAVPSARPAKKAAPAAKAATKKTQPARASAPRARTKATTPVVEIAEVAVDHEALPRPRGHTKDGIAYTKDFDSKFLKTQRDLLTTERKALLGQADRLEDEANSLIEDGEMGDVQFDDESGEGDTMVVERERDLALSAQARQTVADIDAALARLTIGTYGYSLISGRPIPRERLEAIPWATELVEEKVGGIGRR